MKVGIRKPSWKKSLAARTSIKRRIMPRMPRGYGFLRNPKKALYNKVYNRTSVSGLKLIKSGSKGCASVFLFAIIILIICLFTASFANAQRILPAKDYNQLKAAEDSLISNSPQYHFVQTDSSKVYGTNGVEQTLFRDIFKDSKQDSISFEYDKTNGVYCNTMLGSFEGLFPFWKRYFQPTANHDKVKLLGGDARSASFTHLQNSEEWYIYIH